MSRNPSPTIAEYDTVGEDLERNEHENSDVELYDGSSESDETGSGSIYHPQTPSEMIIGQPQTSASSASCLASPRFQQPLTPMTMNDAGNACPDLSWSGSTAHLQPYSELSTPNSDAILSLDPLQPKPSSWLHTTFIDEDMFDKENILDFEMFDMPGLCNDSNDAVQGEIDDSAIQNKDGGNVTVTLTQVDPDIAMEIMGSVLKYSKRLKIQCIVNDA